VRLVDDLLEISRITRGKIELRRESIEAGIDRHVTKPIDVDALKALLGSLLRTPRASVSL